jgi:hypothetical protein
MRFPYQKQLARIPFDASNKRKFQRRPLFAYARRVHAGVSLVVLFAQR